MEGLFSEDGKLVIKDKEFKKEFYISRAIETLEKLKPGEWIRVSLGMARAMKERGVDFTNFRVVRRGSQVYFIRL